MFVKMQRSLACYSHRINSAVKKFFYFLIFYPLLAVTCNKSDVHSDDITGTWELVEYSGQIPLTKAPAGTERLKLTATTYEIQQINLPVQKGTYTVSEDNSIESEVCLVVKEGEYTHSAILSNFPRKIFFQVDGNEMRTLSGCFAYDGGSYKMYVRIDVGAQGRGR